MSIKYRLQFNSFHGNQGNYRLEISNTDYSGGLETIYTDGQVISIDRTKDYSDYSPIISSTARVTLIEQNGVTYDRFQLDGNQTWKVELLYEDPANIGDYLCYWVGWIIAESYNEQIITEPRYISFNATDGLGDLSRLRIGNATSEDEVSLTNYIAEGLRRTNLGLDIYYNTGLAAAGTSVDYLDMATVHPYAFYKDDLVERCFELDRISTILTGVNSRLFQSRGRWYVTSWSDYNGVVSGTDDEIENITFNVRNFNGVAQTPVTENVRRVIAGAHADRTDLASTGSNLELQTRESWFSATQQIDNYTIASLNANPLFELSGTGYTWPNAAIPQAFDTSTVLNGTRSVSTGVVGADDTISSTTEWFRTNPITPPGFFNTYKLRFAYRADSTNTGIAEAEVRFRVVIDFDDDTGGVFNRSDLAVYDFEANQWHLEDVDSRGDRQYETEFTGRATTTSFSEWNDYEIDLAGLPFFALGDSPLFRLEFHTPLALSAGGTIQASTTALTTRIDNVRILPNVTFQPAHFERNQTATNNYSKEYVTQTAITTRGEDIFYNRLSETTVKRVKNSSETLSLEEIVTQQRLNDNRNGGAYYRGDFITLHSEPLSMHHKPIVDYDNRSESVGGVIDEIGYSAKSNISRLLFRVPNQATDVASTFNEFDVQPQIIEREDTGFRTVTLELSALGLDDMGDAIVFSDSGTSTNVINTNTDIITASGLPGESRQVRFEVINNPNNTDQYELQPSNFYRIGSLEDPDVEDVDDGDYEPIPSYITNIQFVSLGGNVLEGIVDLTIPRRNDNVQLDFEGEVDPFIADNRSYELTFALASSVGNAVISANSRTLRGPVGGVSFAEVLISPAANHSLTASTFSVSGALPTGVTLLGISQFGTSVLAEFSIEFQATNQTATITLTGDSGTALAPSGVDTSTVTFDLTESIANVSTITDFSVTGVQGTTSEFNIPLYAADSFTLDPDNFSAAVTGSPANIVMYDAVGGGESVQIPFRITFPTTETQTATITINGSAQAIGDPTTDIAVTFTVTGDATLTETTETFTGTPGTALLYTNDVIPDTDLFITSITIGTLTGDTTAVTLTASGTGARGKIQGTINFSDDDQTVTIPITVVTEDAPDFTTSAEATTIAETAAGAVDIRLATTAYRLTGVAVPLTSPQQYLGFATFVDGVGMPRRIATGTSQTIDFCSAETPVALAGTVVLGGSAVCAVGTVTSTSTESFAEQAGAVNGISLDVNIGGNPGSDTDVLYIT